MNQTPEFMAAISKHLRLVEELGMDHPDTMRQMLLVMEVAPPAFVDEIHGMAKEMGLIPEASDYLEDGTPLYRLEDIAERLGVPPKEAEESLLRMLADREDLGLSNAGVVTDPARIHRRH